MQITVHVFAGLREALGGAAVPVTVGPDTTAARLKQALKEQYPQAAALLEASYIAVNHAYAAPEAPIREGDEVAVIPPVSGGEGRDSLYEITREPLSVEEVTRKVIHPHHGAVLTFTGTTREFTHGKRTTRLEYEAYPEMALSTLRQIGDEIDRRWPGTRCAISHRLGPVGIGEISVVIAVSSPHRADCYDASRYAIERLKQIVPIWKKEIWEDGSEWKGHQQGPWNPTVPLDRS